MQAPQSASCTIGHLLEGEHAAEVAELLADKSIKHSTAAKVLRSIGFSTTSMTVGRHRRNQCQCQL